MMQTKEPLPKQDYKPWAEMSPEEWESYKRDCDARRAAEGLPPVKWERFGQPRRPTEADIAEAIALADRLGLRPVKR
jgi:hypothetical protein